LSQASGGAAAPDPQAEDSAVTNFILSHYANVEVANSFADAAGHAIDCIPMNQQPAVRGLEGPAAPPAEFLEVREGPRRRTRDLSVAPPPDERRKDQFGNDAKCPEGCIPVMRVTPERIRSVGGFANLFSKAPGGGRHPSLGSGPPSPRPAATRGLAIPAQDVGGAIHAYAHASQVVTDGPCTGARSWLNLWTPNPAPGVFSLSQQWIAGGSGSGLQTIEGGWHVYPGLYNDSAPITRLFIYWTADGYSQTGNYNLLYRPGQPAFVQTDNSWVLGGAFQKTSVVAGDQPGFMMQWRLDPAQGRWWLVLQGTGDPVALGYFPTAIFGGGPLSNAAESVDFGGEVCSEAGSNQAGPMGSGSHATTGWQQSAFHKEIAYFSAGQWIPATLARQQQDAPAYTIDAQNKSSSPWSTHFFFGGPGGQLA